MLVPLACMWGIGERVNLTARDRALLLSEVSRAKTT